MTTIILGAFIFAVISFRIMRHFGIHRWQVSIGLLILAVFLYVLNISLIRYFIRKRASDFASSEEGVPGIQKWEVTAGLGIVPKWVSFIGLLFVSALITAVLPWIVIFIKSIF